MAYNGINFNRARMGPRSGIIDPSRIGPPQMAVDGGSMRQGIINAPTMREALMQTQPQQSVDEILSEPLGEMTPNFGRATSEASRQREIADMLLQGAQQQDNTSIAGGLSQLGQAFLARRAGQKADTAEEKQREMASLLLQQAIGEGPESQAARAQLFADNPAAMVAQSDVARRQALEDTRYVDELNYSRGRDATEDMRYVDELNYLRGRDQTADELAASLAAEDTRRFGLNYGLNLKQTNAAVAAATAEGAKINVDDESAFRREYNSVTSGFRDVQASYGRIKATDATTPAGQLSLVYQYMKMLDPGSTVMQGEQASASNAAGVPEKVKNLYNSIIEGKPLSAAQVTDFTNQADLLYARSLQDYDKTRTTYEGLANLYNYDPARVVPDFATSRTVPAVGDDGVPNLLRRPAAPANTRVGPSGQLVPEGYE